MTDDAASDPDGFLAYLDSVPPDEGDAAPPVRLAFSRPDLPTITLQAGELHNIASAAEQALLDADAPFFIRGDALVRPVMDDMPASHGRRTKVARLAGVTEPMMVDRLSRAAEWQKFDGRAKKAVPVDPPAKIAATVLSRDGEWRFRRLSGVITTPTLRPDGTILSQPGYDEATQLLLLDPPPMPRIRVNPSQDQARSALGFLDRLLDEFPFIDDASRSVALSALITPVVRGALPVAPMHATTAPVPGSGKSYIIDLSSAINSGEAAPVLTAGRTEEETEKRLVAALLSGQTIVSIDNVNGQLGGDFLCQIIERPVVAVRPLGQSQFSKIESRACCFATGNNIQLVGDMTRRVLLCSLDPDVERPELRTFDANPFDAILTDRGKYVAAALTVVRAYVAAGYPETLRPLASFAEWSRMVRSALVWLGRADPCETMARARADDPVTSLLTTLFTAWHAAVGETPQTTAMIKDVSVLLDSFDTPMNPALREALVEAADDGREGVNARRLGKWLARYQGRVVAGLKLVSPGEDRNSVKLWKVIGS